MVFDTLLDPILAPLLAMPPVWGIFIVSLIVGVGSTYAYKYLTDQARIKHLRGEIKKGQTQIKASAEDPAKMKKIQEKMMKQNGELMKNSFKPMLYTFLPIIIIFGWMNAHFMYESLAPDTPFLVTVQFEDGTTGQVDLKSIPDLQSSTGVTAEIVDGIATWSLKGGEGTYTLTFDKDGFQEHKDIIISSQPGEYEMPEDKFGVPPFKAITIGNEKVKPLLGWPIVGNWGWIGTYILFSIIISTAFRKILKVA